MRRTQTINWFLLAVLGLISWGIGIYFYTVPYGPMVVYLMNRYYWVDPFWGFLTATIIATALTILLALYVKTQNQFKQPRWSGITVSSVTNFIWLGTIWLQIYYFNLNEGICH